MREVVAVDVAPEALGNRGVPDDVFEPLWSVLLHPDFLPTAGGVCHTHTQALPGLKGRETASSRLDDCALYPATPAKRVVYGPTHT
ncbi:hypothetical protein GCM10009000_095810 [Halobacterium noricense]